MVGRDCSAPKLHGSRLLGKPHLLLLKPGRWRRGCSIVLTERLVNVAEFVIYPRR